MRQTQSLNTYTGRGLMNNDVINVIVICILCMQMLFLRFSFLFVLKWLRLFGILDVLSVSNALFFFKCVCKRVIVSGNVVFVELTCLGYMNQTFLDKMRNNLGKMELFKHLLCEVTVLFSDF